MSIPTLGAEDPAEEDALSATPSLDESVVEDNRQAFLSQEHWEYAMSMIRNQIYNSTSAIVPSPVAHIVQYDRKSRPNAPPIIMPKRHLLQNFNSQPHVKDIDAYRCQRSENLLLRIVSGLGMDQKSVIRLSKGVFIAQHNQHTPSQLPAKFLLGETVESPSMLSDFQSEAPVDTFYLEDMMNTSRYQTNVVGNGFDKRYVPYSYTFGARYTDVYFAAKDILIRGNIPLWCQILFLSECMAHAPIQVNETRTGLFSCAPDVPVTFRPFSVDASRENAFNLDWILAYEYNAMELGDLDAQNGVGMFSMNRSWTTGTKITLEQMLFCDILDDDAKIITELSTRWASSQGLNI